MIVSWVYRYCGGVVVYLARISAFSVANILSEED